MMPAPAVDGPDQRGGHPLLRSNLRVGRRVEDSTGGSCVVVQDPILRGIRHPGFRLSAAAEDLLCLLDGSRSVPELAARMARAGHRQSEAAIAAFLARLAERHLLDTPAVAAMIADLELQFGAMPVRPMSNHEGDLPAPEPAARAAVAGYFDRVARTDALRRLLERRRPDVLVVPHAGSEVSRTCAAAAMSLLEPHPLARLYVVIGPNHVVPGVASAEVVAQPFETPLGQIEVDAATCEALTRADPGVVTAHLGHFRDHSIENVLFYLQWLHERRPGAAPLRIVPLLLTGLRHRPGLREPADHLARWRALGALLRRLHRERRPDVVFVVSGDFTHVGPYFGFTPAGVASADDVLRWEAPMHGAITAGDGVSFLRSWVATNACVGRPLITALLMAAGWRWEPVDHAVAEQKGTFLSLASYAGWPEA